MNERYNPYKALKTAARKWAFEVTSPRRVKMFHYPTNRLGEGWALTDLAQRVAAANQLGYDVLAEMTEQGLQFSYVKRPPPLPWELER